MIFIAAIILAGLALIAVVFSVVTVQMRRDAP